MLWNIEDTIRIETKESLIDLIDQEFKPTTPAGQPNINGLIKLMQDELGLDKAQLTAFIKTFKNQKVLIYGDYDADGVISSFILKRLLKIIGSKAFVFLPHRERDGYGINQKTLSRLEKAVEFDGLISVDNGVSALDVLEDVKKRGKKVGVIDHHLKKDGYQKPQIDLMIHSTLTCASGLVFGLACLMYTEKLISQKDWEELLQLAAVGILADQMSLRGFNYMTVKTAFKSIKESQIINKGVRELVKQAGYRRVINEYAVNFIIAPRINATGRMGEAGLAYQLLGTKAQENLSRLGAEIEKINKQRQVITKEFLMTAEEKMLKLNDFIVFYDPLIPEGILGLLASSLSQKHTKPALVIGGQDKLKGSGRSVGQFDLTSFLRSLGGVFESLGGHKKACGFTVSNKQALDALIGRLKNKRVLVDPAYKIKYLVSPKALDEQVPFLVEDYGPFGNDRQKPYFLLDAIKVQAVQELGQTGKHFKLKIEGCQGLDFVVFGVETKVEWGQVKRLVVASSLNHFNGRIYPQFRIIDVL